MSYRTTYTNIKISTVNAVCSSGKSYALLQHIKQNSQHRNHLVVLPTQKLVDQFLQDAKNHGIPLVDSITTKTHPQKVKSAITTYLKSTMDTGHTLVITWQGYEDLPYFENKEYWDIFIDELPQIDNFHDVDISKNKQLITDFIELKQSINSDVYQVGVIDGCRYKLEQASKSNDDGYANFRALYRAVLSDNRDVFVSSKNWDEAVDGKDIKKGGLTFVAMLNPKQFSKATLLAANINDSLLYHWFTKYHQIQFEPHQAITKNLRFETHTGLSDLVDIRYFIDRQDYSKYLRDRVVDGQEVTIGEQMDKLAVSHFDGKDFLVVTNKKYNSPLLQHSNIETLPVKAHGLNSYQNYSNIYLNMALNSTPQHGKLLEDLGLNRDIVRIANTFDAIYQCVMRTALRDVDNKKLVSIITPDIFSADYLMDILGASGVSKIDGVIMPTKQKPLTATQKNKNARYNAKTTALCEQPLVFDNNKNTHKTLRLYTHKENSNVSCKLQDMSNEQVAITIHNEVKATNKDEFVDWIMTTKELIDLLKTASTVNNGRKLIHSTN